MEDGVLQRLPNGNEPHRRRRGNDGNIRRFGCWVATALETVAIWLDRSKKRRQLARLSEREIKDLGASRSDVMIEINKPFWCP